MKALVESRGPDMNGAKEGTAELSFGDPDGIVCQLQDAGYCGGAGPLGNVCGAPERAPKGLLALRDYSHLTIFSSDSQRVEQVLSGSVRLLDPLVSGSDRADARGRADRRSS